MPSRPFSNSSSSLVIAECRPSTRAMPSPVSVTRPTSSRAVSGVYEATLRSIASRISSGRIVSSVMCSCSFARLVWSALLADPSPDLFEAVDDGAVEDLVAHLDPDAANHIGIDDLLQFTPRP